MRFGLIIEDSTYGLNYVQLAFKEKVRVKKVYPLEFIPELVSKVSENLNIGKAIIWNNSLVIALKDLERKKHSYLFSITPTRYEIIAEISGNVEDFTIRNNELLFGGDFGIEG